MDQAEYEQIMRELAAGIQDVLNELFGNIGFALLLFDFNNPGIGNYISNANRQDMIKALIECAERLEKNQFIPATIGSKQ